MKATTKNAQAVDNRMKRIERQIATASGKVQVQLVAELRRLRAARTVSLNAAIG